MNPDEFTEFPQKPLDTQPSPAGGPPQPPPRPPKRTSQDLLDPGEPGKRVAIGDYIAIEELAALLNLKAFRVVAEVLALGQFKHADELIDFPTAAAIAEKHGYVAEKADWD